MTTTVGRILALVAWTSGMGFLLFFTFSLDSVEGPVLGDPQEYLRYARVIVVVVALGQLYLVVQFAVDWFVREPRARRGDDAVDG